MFQANLTPNSPQYGLVTMSLSALNPSAGATYSRRNPSRAFSFSR